MRCLPLVYLLLTSAVCTAQDWTFFGAFPAISQSGSISKKLGYTVLLSATVDAFQTRIRQTEFPATALQYYLQPNLNYKFSTAIQAGAGYAYVRHDLFGLRVNENRLWIQAVAAHKVPQLGPLRLSHRLRYEERYPVNQRTNQRSCATLLRYQVGGQYLLYDAKTAKTGFYAVASNEFFFCLTGATNSPISAKNALYGENWLCGGIGYTTRNLGKFEIGYCYQQLIRNPAQDHRRMHLLQVTWAANFDLSELAVWYYAP